MMGKGLDVQGGVLDQKFNTWNTKRNQFMLTKNKFIIVIGILIAIYPTYRWYWNKTSMDYFQSRCEQDAGEFIYRTVENVEGLFQMRPRDPRDYFTRLREGDLPEDPYGHTNYEARKVESLFVYPSKNRNYYQYLETARAPNAGKFYDRRFPTTKLAEEPKDTGEKYWRYSYFGPASDWGSLYVTKQISDLQSKYAFTWREIRSEKDKRYGVWEGELIVKELKTDEILGIKKGFFYKNEQTGDMTICPKGKNDTMVVDFISKVLIPAEITNGGEG
ncbi:MAG: hypothetical protein D8M62_02840 [Proteobacteria bacterium]|nr:hypothetical protein [Pseudomonadota bacterium]